MDSQFVVLFLILIIEIKMERRNGFRCSGAWKSFNPLSLLSFSLGAIHKVRTYVHPKSAIFRPLTPYTGVSAFKLTPPPLYERTQKEITLIN